MKTVWFYRRQSEQVRAIWCGLYSAQRVRRTQWTRALTLAVTTIEAVAPMVEDEQTLTFIRQQLEALGAETNSWSL